MQLGFAKAHNNIPSGRKNGRGRGLRELPNILGVPKLNARKRVLQQIAMA